MKIETLVFSEGKALNRIFKIAGLNMGRFGSTADALRFEHEWQALEALASLPAATRATCSLQKFVKQ